MSAEVVRAVIAAAARRDPAAGLALRLAAITGARRAELCALVWPDFGGCFALCLVRGCAVGGCFHYKRGVTGVVPVR